MKGTYSNRLLALARTGRLLRPRDVEAKGIPRDYLSRLVQRGYLARVGRGLYTLAEHPATEHHSLALVAKHFPKGTICLLSALRFHELTTQQPHEVWMALPQNVWRPTSLPISCRFVRFSGAALTEGVKIHRIEGVSIRIYTAAKTVADCFKYRHKIGLDVAIEALRDALRQKKSTIDEIYKYAQICRVAKIMRPYLESVV